MNSYNFIHNNENEFWINFHYYENEFMELRYFIGTRLLKRKKDVLFELDS